MKEHRPVLGRKRSAQKQRRTVLENGFSLDYSDDSTMADMDENAAEKYLSCSNSLLDRSIVKINVSGKRYQTFDATLKRYPDTLLGCAQQRDSFYDPEKGEYFFDRNRSCFTSILYYYQSEGSLIRPVNLSPDVFLQECTFFGLEKEAQISLGFDDDGEDDSQMALPENGCQRKVWEAFEVPSSSMVARVLAVISLSVILISIIVFCIESLPDLRGYKKVWFIISAICNGWFTIEFVLRLASSPNKMAFLKGTLNIIDVVSILPFYVQLILDGFGVKGDSVEVLRVLRIIRVVRIFKLTRHSRGLYILGNTLKSSRSELFMLLLFMILGMILFASGVYYCEMKDNPDQFQSIPHSFWWAIVTMTTVGYGDVSPKTGPGKVIGAMCALSGVLAIALPVPVIVSNFEYYYKEELARQVAEQAREKRMQNTETERENSNCTVHLPHTMACSQGNLDQEILELKGITKPSHKLSDHGNNYTKMSPMATPNTARRKTETAI